jgi:hypothetical protein
LAVRLATRLFGEQNDEEQVLEWRRIGITNGLEVQLNFRWSNIYCSDIFQQKLVYDSIAAQLEVNLVLHSTLQYWDETMIRPMDNFVTWGCQ